MTNKCVGSTDDSLASAETDPGRELDDGLLNLPFFIVEDETYNCTDYLRTPFPTARAAPDSASDFYSF